MGVGEVLGGCMLIMIWMMTIRRQTLRMNVLLFQSLIQRVSHLLSLSSFVQKNSLLFIEHSLFRYNSTESIQC
jgi:hypothetical protein